MKEQGGAESRVFHLTTAFSSDIVSLTKAMTGTTPCYHSTERERHRLKAFLHRGQDLTTPEPPTEIFVGWAGSSRYRGHKRRLLRNRKQGGTVGRYARLTPEHIRGEARFLYGSAEPPSRGDNDEAKRKRRVGSAHDAFLCSRRSYRPAREACEA